MAHMSLSICTVSPVPLHTQSVVLKQQTQEGQHKDILVLIAFQRAAMAHTSIGIMQFSQSLRFTQAQSMEEEEVSDKAFDL